MKKAESVKYIILDGIMRKAVHTLLILILLMTLVGCFFNMQYPKQWPPILSSSGKPCPDISGDYRNIAIGGYLSLSDVLLKKWYGNRYYPTNRRVTISQMKDSIYVTTYCGWITGVRKTLILGRDYQCSEGRVMFSKSEFVGDIATGYSAVTFAFQKAEDGSLILHTREWGAGVVALIIPFVARDSRYYRFSKY